MQKTAVVQLAQLHNLSAGRLCNGCAIYEKLCKSCAKVVQIFKAFFCPVFLSNPFIINLLPNIILTEWRAFSPENGFGCAVVQFFARFHKNILRSDKNSICTATSRLLGKPRLGGVGGIVKKISRSGSVKRMVWAAPTSVVGGWAAVGLVGKVWGFGFLVSGGA